MAEISLPGGDVKPMDKLRQHYEIEKELADRLRKASRQDRRQLYSSLYNELYRRVPFHPQLTRKYSPEESRNFVVTQLKFIRPFLNSGTTYLEVGPGDCSLAFEVASLVKQVYAVDVSDEITKSSVRPANCQLILSDGSSVPVPQATVDVAYSNQLMEHLHPEDAFEQLQNICRALTPAGIYVCITPNRLNGPHDISMYFDEQATGFHMKEYTTSELASLFKRAGFSRVKVCIGARGKYVAVPAFPIVLFEGLLKRLPRVLRKVTVRMLPFRLLIGYRFIGIK